MKCMRSAVVVAAGVLVAFAAPVAAQPPGFPLPRGGAGVFQRACAACHVSPAADSRAPSQATLAGFQPDTIVNALTNGSMRIQGEKLTDAERRDVAEFLTGRAVGAVSTVTLGQCAASS